MAGLPIELGPRGRSSNAPLSVAYGDDALMRIERLRRRVAAVAASGGFLLGLAAIAAALKLPTYL